MATKLHIYISTHIWHWWMYEQTTVSYIIYFTNYHHTFARKQHTSQCTLIPYLLVNIWNMYVHTCPHTSPASTTWPGTQLTSQTSFLVIGIYHLIPDYKMWLSIIAHTALILYSRTDPTMMQKSAKTHPTTASTSNNCHTCARNKCTSKTAHLCHISHICDRQIWWMNIHVPCEVTIINHVASNTIHIVRNLAAICTYRWHGPQTVGAYRLTMVHICTKLQPTIASTSYIGIHVPAHGKFVPMCHIWSHWHQPCDQECYTQMQSTPTCTPSDCICWVGILANIRNFTSAPNIFICLSHVWPHQSVYSKLLHSKFIIMKLTSDTNCIMSISCQSAHFTILFISFVRSNWNMLILFSRFANSCLDPNVPTS